MKMGRIIFFFLVFTFACKTEKRAIQANLQNNLAPIMLDEIHYYSVLNDSLKPFFIKNFNAKRMKEQPFNPIKFIDFLSVHPDQATLNLSPKGPFEGIKVGDPKRWEKETVPPSPTLAPMYGVHWVAFATNNLAKSLSKMEKNGVKIAQKSIKLPNEPHVKTAAIYTPDYNLLVLVEKPKAKLKSEFSIDHIQLLVNSLEDNIKFFTEVFQAKIKNETVNTAVMEIGQHLFVISEPEGLGLAREKVVSRDPKKFRSNIDHLGFLYADAQPAYENAVAKGYQFLLKPTPFNYFEKPTPYSFGILFSPDGLQCEMVTEKGRTSARVMYAE